MKPPRFHTIAILIALLASLALAHDTWLQPNSNIVRVGDVIYLDWMLGNHGNGHRDFKIAGKPSLEDATVRVIDPDGRSYDLKPSMIDQGYAPKEGFWTARFEPAKPGLYLVSQTSDKIADYAPLRSVHSAKTFFLASKTLDHVSMFTKGFDRILGDPLELVPQTHPITPMGPGQPLTVQLLYKGKPLPNATVSFIPRGTKLKEGFDPAYDRKTDEKGLATFEPKEANYYLIAAHHEDPNDKGQGYTATKYSATLTLLVPAICPCCGE
jgi:uncharacterized GH25 family protein